MDNTSEYADFVNDLRALAELPGVPKSVLRPFHSFGVLVNLIEGRKARRALWKQQQVQREVKAAPRPLCGALTRAGGTCRARCVEGRSRC